MDNSADHGDGDTIRAEIDTLLASIPQPTYPTMAELDAEFYDEFGLPRSSRA